MRELIKIQSQLKAPKGQFNNFGKYKYRSCEDILEALKPLLKENECHLTLSDEPLVIGNRFYIQATATLTSLTESVSVKAFAREEEAKKGMDGSQITGTASSYARKYALNGLFCIDDTKDSNSNELATQQRTQPQRQQPQPQPQQSQTQASQQEDADLAIAIDTVYRAANLSELRQVWESWKGYQGHPAFKEAKDKRKVQLSKPQ